MFRVFRHESGGECEQGLNDDDMRVNYLARSVSQVKLECLVVTAQEPNRLKPSPSQIRRRPETMRGCDE